MDRLFYAHAFAEVHEIRAKKCASTGRDNRHASTVTARYDPIETDPFDSATIFRSSRRCS
jgi:hypothetical protein